MVTLVSTSKTFNVAALHAATGIVPNPLLREHFTRAINKYEVAELNLLAIPGTIAAYTQGAYWLHQKLITWRHLISVWHHVILLIFFFSIY